MELELHRGWPGFQNQALCAFFGVAIFRIMELQGTIHESNLILQIDRHLKLYLRYLFLF